MKTILLVSDDPTALNGLEELLQRRRYAVIATRDGSTTLAAITSEERIDLVIMEHRMSGIGDLAILRALRQTRPNVPAIILTERGTLDSYLQASSLGVTAYLERTVGSRELLRIVADALGDSTKEEKAARQPPHAVNQGPETKLNRASLKAIP